MPGNLLKDEEETESNRNVVLQKDPEDNMVRTCKQRRVSGEREAKKEIKLNISVKLSGARNEEGGLQKLDTLRTV